MVQSFVKFKYMNYKTLFFKMLKRRHDLYIRKIDQKLKQYAFIHLIIVKTKVKTILIPWAGKIIKTRTGS